MCCHQTARNRGEFRTLHVPHIQILTNLSPPYQYRQYLFLPKLQAMIVQQPYHAIDVVGSDQPKEGYYDVLLPLISSIRPAGPS